MKNINFERKGFFSKSNVPQDVCFDAMGITGDPTIPNGEYDAYAGQKIILFPSQLINDDKILTEGEVKEMGGAKIEFKPVPYENAINYFNSFFYKSFNDDDILSSNRDDLTNMMLKDENSTMKKSAAGLFLTLKAILARSLLIMARNGLITVTDSLDLDQKASDLNGAAFRGVVGTYDDTILELFGYKTRGFDKADLKTINSFILNLFIEPENYNAKSVFTNDIPPQLKLDTNNSIKEILRSTENVLKVIDNAYIGMFIDNAKANEPVRIFFDVKGK